MSGVLANVDLRTQLAGHNRLELLLFRLDSKQLFGINVFKVQEVIQCPPLTQVPDSHPVVRGITIRNGYAEAGRGAGGGAMPPPQSHSELTGRWPRSARRRLTG